MRWILIASTLVFAVPVVCYIVLFQKFHIAVEILVGAFSFIFYGPTYLNILNIYALCRIDDISWGTKGLEAGGGKNSQLKQKWYLLKMVQVGKFLLWNTVLGVVLLSVGAGYQPRFFITLVMVSVIAFTLAIKIIIAIGYMICYKLTSACGEEH
jgi:chitin synthase